jgi:hypothetical protein
MEQTRKKILEKNDELLYKVAQRVFEEATSDSLGATFHVIISFHLKKKLDKDPYEVLVDNPSLFYEGLTYVIGEGAEALITLVAAFIKVKYVVDLAADGITQLFTQKDLGSAEKMRELLRTIIAQEQRKLKNDNSITR